MKGACKVSKQTITMVGGDQLCESLASSVNDRYGEPGNWVRTVQDFKAVTSIHLVCTIYPNTLDSTMLRGPLKPTANRLTTESRRVVPSRTPYG